MNTNETRTLFIDADGCPVVDIAIRLCKRVGVECIIICDTSHVFEKPGVKTITVSKGNDSSDFALVNKVSLGDIVISQDYGLAAMCLAKKATPINQDGMIYTDNNIDSLLMQRYTAKKVRMSGGRLKGPSKRTAQQDESFERTLNKLLLIEGSKHNGM